MHSAFARAERIATFSFESGPTFRSGSEAASAPPKRYFRFATINGSGLTSAAGPSKSRLMQCRAITLTIYPFDKDVRSALRLISISQASSKTERLPHEEDNILSHHEEPDAQKISASAARFCAPPRFPASQF